MTISKDSEDEDHRQKFLAACAGLNQQSRKQSISSWKRLAILARHLTSSVSWLRSIPAERVAMAVIVSASWLLVSAWMALVMFLPVEKFNDMREDLNKERKFMSRQWAKRETQIASVIESTVGMVGDLQAIAGKAMPEIPSLEVPLLENSAAPERKAS